MAKNAAPTSKPKPGEVTTAQRGNAGDIPGMNRVAGGLAGGDGFKPGPGTFKTYRKMRSHPTIALARMVATAPIRTAEIGVEAEDGVPQERVDFIRKIIRELWHEFINDALLALDYGYAPFEVVYEESEGQISVAKIKPLLVDITTILCNKDTGAMTGLKNKNVEIEAIKCLLYTHDAEAGNYYGRSLLENMRETAWADWMALQKKWAVYGQKVAGALPMVIYPDGESHDEGGAIRPNWEIAKRLVEKLTESKGIYMPDIPREEAADFARQGVDRDKTRAWQVTTFEAKGQHGDEFKNMMTYCDQLMLRGYLVPERAAVEAQASGSRADSESHGDLVLSIADLKLTDICQAFNRQVVNPLLRCNYGAKAEKSVWIESAGIAPGMQSFFRALVTACLQAPANVQMLIKLVDMPTLCALAGLPKPKIEVTADELAEAVKPPEPPMGGSPGKPVRKTAQDSRQPDDGAEMGLAADEARDMVESVREVYRAAHMELANFNEAEHPRAGDGQFAPVPGGPSTPVVMGKGGVGTHPDDMKRAALSAAP